MTTDLTAIDILIEPDAAALARAVAENARLRAQAPDGFALDESHQPHITLLQRYVWTAELDQVFSVVAQTLGAHHPDRLSFRATGLRHMPVAAMPGFGIAAIVATPGAGVLDLQLALIEAVAPFTGTGGTAAAFETTIQEPEINGDTLTYVERYVPDHSGANFVAHMTVGLAPLDLLGAVEAKPFEELEFHPSTLAIFKLGDNGTARRRLASWPVSAPG